MLCTCNGRKQPLAGCWFIQDTVHDHRMYTVRWSTQGTVHYHHMWCGRKVMRLATLYTNQQGCCLPLHMAVRLTPAIDSVQVWTCYSCYAIVERPWSEVVFARSITKMDWQRFEQHFAIKFCVKFGESATVTYENLQRAYGEHSLSRTQVFRCSDGTSPF